MLEFSGASLKDKNLVYAQMKNNEFSSNMENGFRNVSIEENYLSGELVQKTSAFIKVYSEESSSVEKQPIDLFIESGFAFDYNYFTLDFLGVKTNYSKFKMGLLKLIGEKINLSEIEININEFIYALEKNNVDYDIHKLSISNFALKKDATGKFEPHIFSKKIGLELLEEYQTDVNSCTLGIFGKLSFNLTISSFCRINLTCEVSDYNSIVSFIKSLIIK